MDHFINGYRIKRVRLVETNDSAFKVGGFEGSFDALGEAMVFARTRPEPGPHAQ